MSRKHRNHIKNYRKFFNLGEQDIVLCELCRKTAQDIHHIEYRSHNGGDEITNLIALCREDHTLAHAGRIKNWELQKIIDIRHSKEPRYEQL